MARRRANEGMTDVEELGLQMTPMIDCIFQLIIFFMLNINFRIEEGLLKAFLPKATQAPSEDDPNKDKVFIRIDKAWQVSGQPLLLALNQDVMGGTTESAKFVSLETELRKKLKLFGEMPPVIVDAHPDVDYKYVIFALNVCGKLKIENVMFQFPKQGS
jgi:biopolymer transport protein ExbD